MKSTKKYTEEELQELATGLFSEGYRFLEIYKFLKERTDDTKLISKIVASIKSNQKANEKRQEELKSKDKEFNYLTGSNPYFDLLMGLFIIAFGVVFTKLVFDGGYIHTFSIVMLIAGLFLIFRGSSSLIK